MVRPVLRWAGGKRWLAEALATVGGKWNAESYVEPFLGGAAVFLHAEWPSPILGDINGELIRCYSALATDHEVVATKLRRLRVEQETFDKVRRWRPTSDTGAAARMLYLNRCAYGGIYRTNRHGQFNVPFSGDRNIKSLLTGSLLCDVGAAMSVAQLRNADFSETLGSAREGSLVFCDPTYVLPGGETTFRRYTSEPFTWADQCRLAEQARALSQAGALVLVSNSSDERVEGLYFGSDVIRLTRRSPFPSAAGSDVKEALYLLGADWRGTSLLTELESKLP